MRSLTRATTLVAILLAVFGATAALRLRAMDHAIAARTYEDIYYLPSAQWLPVLSLGYREALADLIWSRSLVYFGEEVAHRGEVRFVFEYTDAILELDPDFRAVYSWIGTAALYGGQTLTVDDVRRTVRVMERGLEQFPDDGQLEWEIGSILAFELPPLLDDVDAQNAAREEAIPHLVRATELGAGPPWLALTNATILRRIGRAEAAAAHLEEMYALAPDDETQARIVDALSALRQQAYADAFVEAQREENERRESELPYVSPELFFLIGARTREGWRAAYRDGFADAAFDDSFGEVLTAEDTAIVSE